MDRFVDESNLYLIAKVLPLASVWKLLQRYITTRAKY